MDHLSHESEQKPVLTPLTLPPPYLQHHDNLSQQLLRQILENQTLLQRLLQRHSGSRLPPVASEESASANATEEESGESNDDAEQVDESRRKRIWRKIVEHSSSLCTNVAVGTVIRVIVESIVKAQIFCFH
ncbi:hypothetical protein LTR66_005801 [Elasticomyces elasticus]|nr:hypothetical protein LTR66_005801 [Elasticomyces elasticus]